MAVEQGTDMDFPKIFTELEEQAEVMIETCKTIKQENERLKAECCELRSKNKQVVERVSKIIRQLKTVAEVEHYEQ